MKKLLVFAGLAIVVTTLTFCNSSKKATSSTKVAKLTYQGNVQALITQYCSPCHIPSKGGNKRPLDTYASAQANIDDIIRRIELNPGERGFMPFKAQKLSDDVINQFKKWKSDGLTEK